MDRNGKAQLIDEIRQKFQRANATFVAEYQGIKAVDMNDIRKALRDASIELKVVRNTLAKRAVSGTEAEKLAEHLFGAVAVVFSYKDAAQAAKKLTEFAKEKPQLKLMGGTLGPKLITVAEIKGLAELPSRDVLVARLLGSMNSPASGFVGVLSAVPRSLVYALDAVRRQKEAAA